jgi:hypothetical protein
VRDAGDRPTERWGGVPVDCNIRDEKENSERWA